MDPRLREDDRAMRLYGEERHLYTDMTMRRISPSYRRFIPTLSHLPVAFVILISLLIAFLNIDFSAHYIGWDNVLPELDLWRYVRQVVWGAWIEHNGMGAASGQAQLVEVFRLPFIIFLYYTIPAHLNRIVYIFFLYTVGGVTMYMYLSRVWLTRLHGLYRSWVAAVGGVLYLLHLLTLQQFYIAFEMFMVQFAYLPLVLLTVHTLARGITRRSLLIFMIGQLLIGPSGHTPTVFYLGVIVTLLYAAGVQWSKGVVATLKFVLLVGITTFAIHAYWIIPNLYYASGPARAVKESRENLVFGPEALWSVHDAANLKNFLSGTHYLFTWQHYSFEKQKQIPTFSAWDGHLANPLISVMAQLIGVITCVGLVLAIFDKGKGHIRWSILGIYMLSLLLLWLGFFPDWLVIDRILGSKMLLEMFRNPFTKLSIIYSVACVLFFVQSIEWLVHRAVVHHAKLSTQKVYLIITAVFALIIIVAWPSFQGHFINKELQIIVPKQYEHMFSYLQSRSRNLRTMQLPQYRYVGWEYYDWTFVRPGNGYQGMGFYFCGMPQPYLMRDFDRWGETGDFYSHELKYAIDNKDPIYFINVLKKYNVDLVIIDETKIDPWKKHDYSEDHEIARTAGLTLVWKEDFLTIYERESIGSERELIIPQKIAMVDTEARRVRIDSAFAQGGEYIQTTPGSAKYIYPFAHLLQRLSEEVTIEGDAATYTAKVPQGSYRITLPGIVDKSYRIPVHISFIGKTVRIIFPTYTLSTTEGDISIPTIKSTIFNVQDLTQINLYIQNTFFTLKQGQTLIKETSIDYTYPVDIGYVPVQNELINHSSSGLPIYVVDSIHPDWQKILNEQIYDTGIIDELKFTATFPPIPIDIRQNKPENCSYDNRGLIETQSNAESIVYTADQYGVNCSGYSFSDIDFNYPYLLHIIGKNHLGRGMKFFLNFEDQAMGSDDYIYSQKSYSSTITLPQLRSKISARPTLNWETRSPGKLAIAELNSMSLLPFPINQLGMLRLQNQNIQDSTANKITVWDHTKYFDTLHIIKYSCKQKVCYVGIDQSHDKLWIGVDLSNLAILTHLQYNGWGNVWEVPSGERTVYFFYVIEAIASALILVTLTTFVLLLHRVLKDRKS